MEIDKHTLKYKNKQNQRKSVTPFCQNRLEAKRNNKQNNKYGGPNVRARRCPEMSLAHGPRSVTEAEHARLRLGGADHGCSTTRAENEH